MIDPRPRPWHPFRRTGFCGMRGTVCSLIGVTLLIVLPLLFLLPHLTPTNSTALAKLTPTQNHTLLRNKRSATNEQHKKLGNQQCDNGTAHSTIPTVCVLSNTSATIAIPWSAVLGRGVKASSYGTGYKYYMTNDQKNTGWDTLVADPPGYDWSSHTKTQNAKNHRRLLKLTTNTNGFVLYVNLTDSGNITMTGRSSCWLFLIWAWSSGSDPSFLFKLCQLPLNTSIKQPQTSSVAKERGVIALAKPSPVEWMEITTGISGRSNNWLLLVEQAAYQAKSDCIVCMGPRPTMKIVPVAMDEDCVVPVMNDTNPSSNCSHWDLVYPVTQHQIKKTIFSKDVALYNFTCVNLTGTGRHLGNLSTKSCTRTKMVGAKFDPVTRADVWWWCGDDKIRDKLPKNSSGVCALVSLLLPVSVYQIQLEVLSSVHPLRQKRKTWSEEADPTYIDAIGVPRGVPDQYKLVDQVSAGFESTICWWCTINKNVDRINYIHYNVQRLGNWTQKGFQAVHEQLSATSLMAFQNRVAVDMLLAEKGGVCAMFGEQCCTFIPNNTASDGSLTSAIEGLRTLNKKMKEHSGVDTSMWDNWMSVFGRYKTLVSSIMISLAVFAAILTLCGCCCIPCLRSLVNRMITTAIQPMDEQYAQLLPLLGQYEGKHPDLCPDPNEYDDDFV